MITNFNKIISLGLLISTLAFGFEKVGTTSFQFLKVGMSARSTGMGEAYSAAVFGADNAQGGYVYLGQGAVEVRFIAVDAVG